MKYHEKISNKYLRWSKLLTAESKLKDLSWNPLTIFAISSILDAWLDLSTPLLITIKFSGNLHMEQSIQEWTK